MIDCVANRFDLSNSAAGLGPTCLHRHTFRTQRVNGVRASIVANGQGTWAKVEIFVASVLESILKGRRLLPVLRVIKCGFKIFVGAFENSAVWSKGLYIVYQQVKTEL